MNYDNDKYDKGCFCKCDIYVPDDVTNRIVEDRLNWNDVANGFLLDGYPRNVDQAKYLDGVLASRNIPLDAVLEFQLDNSEIVKRLSGRRVCKNCGATFHITLDKPKRDGICDKCQSELYQREDDKEEVIKRRLEVYAEQTAPIVSFYREEGLLISMSAEGEVEEITQRAISALKTAVS